MNRSFIILAKSILGTFAAVGMVVLAMGNIAWAGDGFTDISKECGIADIVAKQYQTMDKVLADRHYDPNRWWLFGLTLVDLDSTGKLDLFLSGHGMESVIAMNDGKGHFTAVPRTFDNYGKVGPGAIPSPGGEIRGAYDLNEDGKLDLLISYHDNGGMTFLNQTKPGDPAILSFAPYDSGFNAFSRSMGFADLNRDGLVDYFMTADEGRAKDVNPLHLYLGKGDGKWEKSDAQIDVLKEAGGIPCDLNGDGFIDLISVQRGYNPQRRWILLGDGTMKFRNATKECGLEEAGTIFGLGDLNQDGFPDLICGDASADDKSIQLAIYLNDGKGHFTKSTEPIANMEGHNLSTGTWGGAVVADFDNDGIPDIMLGQKGTLLLLRGLGGGKFECVNKAWHVPELAGVCLCFGDINGDGMLDMVAFNIAANRQAIVLRNDLPPQNWLNVQLIGGKGHRAAPNSIIRISDPATGKLLNSEQVCIWASDPSHGYYYAANTERHFGLGSRQKVNISVEFYPSGKKVEKKDVAANQTVIVDESGGEAGASK